MPGRPSGSALFLYRPSALPVDYSPGCIVVKEQKGPRSFPGGSVPGEKPAQETGNEGDGLFIGRTPGGAKGS